MNKESDKKVSLHTEKLTENQEIFLRKLSKPTKEIFLTKKAGMCNNTFPEEDINYYETDIKQYVYEFVDSRINPLGEVQICKINLESIRKIDVYKRNTQWYYEHHSDIAEFLKEKYNWTGDQGLYNWMMCLVLDTDIKNIVILDYVGLYTDKSNDLIGEIINKLDMDVISKIEDCIFITYIEPTYIEYEHGIDKKRLPLLCKRWNLQRLLVLEMYPSLPDGSGEDFPYLAMWIRFKKHTTKKIPTGLPY